MQITQETEDRYGNVPTQLGVGDIWATSKYGIFVVVKTAPANWRGDDLDVYAHVSTWYTIRPANETEQARWQSAVEAANAKREQRKELNAPSHVYNPKRKSLEPTPEMTRRLDSYDDRWEPPTAIPLSAEQCAVEDLAITTRHKLEGNK